MFQMFQPFQLFKSVTRNQQQIPSAVSNVVCSRLSAGALIVAATLGTGACGTPAVGVSVKNPGIDMNATALPTATSLPAVTFVPVTPVTAVTAVTTVTVVPGVIGASTAMSDMAMPTNPAAAVAMGGSATAGPSPTQLVIDHLLFGTPTVTAVNPAQNGQGAPMTITVSYRSTATSNAVSAAVTATVGGGATTAAALTATPSSAPSMAPATSAATGAPTNPPAVAAAVSPTPDAGSSLVGDAARGQALFQGTGACSACHNVANANVLVGPALKGVAVRAQTRKPGYSAAQYLHESIVAPNAYIVSGFTPSIMPQTFAQSLTPQQIADLVAYLLTLSQ